MFARYITSPPDLKCCAVFRVDEQRLTAVKPDQVRPLRDPAGMEVLLKLARVLRDWEGYEVSEPKAARGIEAAFTCELATDRVISVLLGVSRRSDGIIHFDLISEWHPDLFARVFRSAIDIDEACLHKWKAFLEALTRQAERSLGVREIIWLTRSEARERWNDDDPRNP